MVAASETASPWDHLRRAPWGLHHRRLQRLVPNVPSGGQPERIGPAKGSLAKANDSGNNFAPASSRWIHLWLHHAPHNFNSDSPQIHILICLQFLRYIVLMSSGNIMRKTKTQNGHDIQDSIGRPPGPFQSLWPPSLASGAPLLLRSTTPGYTAGHKLQEKNIWERKHSKAPACMHEICLVLSLRTAKLYLDLGLNAACFQQYMGQELAILTLPYTHVISPNIKTIESSVKQTHATSLSDLVNWERQKHQKHLKTLKNKNSQIETAWEGRDESQPLAGFVFVLA